MHHKPSSLSYTPRFTFRRLWNTVLNYIYPEDMETCVLCHRPMLFEMNVNVHEKAHPPLPGVCLFCLQDARKISLKPTVRYLRVRVKRTEQLSEAEGPMVPTGLRSVCPAHMEHRIPVHCALPYDGLVRTAIRAWKYDGAIELTDWFAKSVVQAMTVYERKTARGSRRERTIGCDEIRTDDHDRKQYRCDSTSSDVTGPIYQAGV